MAEAHVDRPGEVTWWSGFGPEPIGGPCPHLCVHEQQRIVAWGPSYERYELVACMDAIGCGGLCRAWTDQFDRVVTAWLCTGDVHVFQGDAL